MKSFSSLVKEEISKNSEKQKLCCAFALLYGLMINSKKKEESELAFSTNAENANSFKNVCEYISNKKKIHFQVKNRECTVDIGVIKHFTFAEIKRMFKCKNCLSSFLRGVFIFNGTVTDPSKMYRLDLTFNDEIIANELKDLLNNELGLNFKITIRNFKFILYTKDYETIASFLGLIGASTYAYVVINSKIEKEIRNEANRMTNCDSANINKSINASQRYCDAIDFIIKEGYFDELPDVLKGVAKKRVEMPSLNLAELGRQFNPSLSKSCVHHRLERIIQFYERIKELK